MSSITVRYFASIRQLVGRSEERAEAAEGETAMSLWSRLAGVPLPPNILIAINQEYRPPESPVRAGDEVAYFPPVTGG